VDNTALIYQEIAATILQYSNTILQDEQGYLGRVLQEERKNAGL